MTMVRTTFSSSALHSARGGAALALARVTRSLAIALLALMLAPQAQAQDKEQTTPATAQAQAAKPQPAQASFDVLEYRVEGTTLLPRTDIERAVYPFLGEKKALKDVEAARAQLEKTYHDRGYLTVAVDLPEQKIVSGVIRLRVIEAPVGKLRVTGSRYYSLGAIKNTVPELAEGKVPNFNVAQTELVQLNRSADRRVTPVLKPSDTPGKVDIDLRVKDEVPLHASLEVNNRYSANTTHERVVAQLSYNNLFQLEHSLSLQYQIAPEKPADAKVWSLSYVIPTHGDWTWAFYAVHSSSNVAALGSLNLIGKGDIYGLRLIQSLPSGPGFSHSLSYGFDYKNFKQSVVLQGADSVDSPVQYRPLSVLYNATWLGTTTETQPAAARTTLDLGANVLLRGMGNREQFADKRYLAEASYFVLHGDLQREQPLPARWSLLGRADFQLAGAPLISNEGFAGGGADSVRGYTESERVGDDGARVSFELHTPSIFNTPSGADTAQGMYGLAFVDAAGLWVRDALPGQARRYGLAGTGLGLRFNRRGLSIDLDAAKALRAGSATRKGDTRFQFRVSYGL